jgi:acyl-CoA synthetase (NDP forming)
MYAYFDGIVHDVGGSMSNMILKEQLDNLFNPKSVAIIGASNFFGKWGYNILNRVLSHKQGRDIYAINHKEPEVMGMKAYRSVVEVPGPVDFAVITVPFQDVPAAMEDCVRKGVKSAVIISGGLAETGEEGARIQREVVEIARRGGIRFIGPNCLGFCNLYTNFCTVPFLPPVETGRVALISQSGNSGQAILDYGAQMGVGFSKFISSGNEADLRFEDYLEYLGQDEKTDIILGYVEGLREGGRFLELAKEITQKKPIIIMKVGRTDVGTRAARSHSSALAGLDVVLDAAFKQCGVIRVDKLHEVIDVAVALLGQSLPRGRRVGVLSMSGGMAVIAADALRNEGLELPPLSAATMEKLESVMSRRWSGGNPVDPAGDFVSYQALWPMIEDENFDAIVVIGGVAMTSGYATWAPALMKHATEELGKQMEEAEFDAIKTTIELMAKHRKPVLFTVGAARFETEGKVHFRLKESHLNLYPDPEESAKVLAHLVRYSEYLGAG